MKSHLSLPLTIVAVTAAIFSVGIVLATSFFYHHTNYNLSLNPTYHGNIFAITSLFLCLTILTALFLSSNRLLYIILQSVPLLLIIAGYLFHELNILLIFSLVIFFSIASFCYCRPDFALIRFIFSIIFFFAIFLYLGWLHLQKPFWMDEFCVGASLTEGLTFGFFGKFEELVLNKESLLLAKSFSQTINNVMLYDAHPPLSEAVFYWIVKAFGFDLAVLRMVTIYLSAFSITYGFMFLWNHKNFQIASLYTLLMVTSPGLADFLAIEIRPYLIMLLLSQISIFAFLKTIQTPTPSSFFTWILSTVFNTYIHYFAIFLFVTFFTIILLFKKSKLSALLIQGLTIITILIVPVTQPALLQRAVHHSWLQSPQIHLTSFTWGNVVAFFQTTLSLSVLLSLSVGSIIFIGINMISKRYQSTDLTFQRTKPIPSTTNSSTFNYSYTTWLIISFITSIALFAYFDFSTLQMPFSRINEVPFYQDMAKTFLFSFSPFELSMITFTLHLIGMICLMLVIKFVRPVGPIHIRMFSKLPTMLQALLLFIVSLLLMAIIINFAGHIYSYRNAIFLLVSLYLFVAGLTNLTILKLTNIKKS